MTRHKKSTPDADDAIKRGDRIEATMAKIKRLLANAGIDRSANESRRLVAAALNLSGAQIILRAHDALTQTDSEKINAFVKRRLNREPLSRILAEREFFGRTFKLSPGTLDPRPDSETLVSAVLEIVAEEDRPARPLRLLDVGTGSGALLITLLAELPQATGLGTDISCDALDTARINAERLGVAGRARFIEWRSLAGVAQAHGTFDIVLSNPPYIPSRDIDGLEPEVKHFDPHASLDGGEDGLDIVREIALNAREAAPDGWLAIEFGIGQADACSKLLADRGLAPPRFWNDLAGHIRCVAAQTH